jgi:hypothetical protein
MSAITSEVPAISPSAAAPARSWPTNLDWRSRVLIAFGLTVLLTLAIVIQGPDSRDVARRAGSGSKPVPSTAARASEPSLDALASGIDAQIAAPWPGLQQPSGRFRNILGGGTRYGEATLGYALLQAGARSDNQAQVHAGLKAIGLALARSVHRSRASVFENLSIAAAYNVAKRSLRHEPAFKRARPRWERFLKTRRLKELAGQHPYDNHYLADAISVLELTRSGLSSPHPTTVVGNQTGAIQTVENLVNVRIPQMAGLNGVTVRGRRTFVLSDPPDNPLAYQGLSLGMYARAVHLLGRRAAPAARETLKQVAQASWWVTAPDGDLGWYGRSQEESWALAATAYGAAAAANLPGLAGRRALDFRALSERALNRLKTAYGTGPRGLYITPAVRKALSHAAPGLDSNAGGPSFTGITLMMLNWLLPELRSDPRAGSQIGSDRDGGVQLSVRDARFAVVRHGDVWFGVRMMPSVNRPDDLRYDFGLHLLKLRRGGRWVDLVPVRPNTGVPLSELRPPSPDGSPGAPTPSAGSRYSTGSSSSGAGGPAPEATTAGADHVPASELSSGPPDSAGPVLMQPDGSAAVPYGDSMQIRSDGAVAVHGGWRTGAGAIVRSGVTFVFAPTRNGIRMTFPRQAGDVIRYSAFFPGVRKPERRPHTLSGHEAVVSWSGRAGVHLRAGYASAVDPHMTRARLTFRSGSGPVRIKVAPVATG